MQEEDEESAYIFDSRSATLNEWKRRNYWDNFPWRPILFTLGLITTVIILTVLIYTFWPSDWLASKGL